MSNAKGDDSGGTIYLHNNDGKDDNGDDSAGETSYLTNNCKRPNPNDRRPAYGGSAAGSNTGGSSITTSGVGSSGPDLGGPMTAAAAPVPAWIAVLGNFLGPADMYKIGSGVRRPDPSGPASTVTTGYYVRTTSVVAAGVYECSRNSSAPTPPTPSTAALSGRFGSSFWRTTTSGTAKVTAKATTHPSPTIAPATAPQ